MDKDGENIWRNTELANSINSFIENKFPYIKMIRVNAELRKEKYDALIDAGFTEAQALHIITTTQLLG